MGVTSGGWNLPGSKVTWPEVKCSSIRRTRIVDFGCVNIRTCNLFVSGPKFTKFFLVQRRKMAVDQICYRFSVCQSATNIFVVRVWSCPKSRQILNLGRSTSASITFLLVNRSSQNFFLQRTIDFSQWSLCFFVDIMTGFWEYLRSYSKVVLNRAKF